MKQNGAGLFEFFKNKHRAMRGRIGFEVEIDMPCVFYNIKTRKITPVYKTSEPQYRETKIFGTDIYISGDFNTTDENLEKVYEFTDTNREIMEEMYSDPNSVFTLNNCELLFLSPDKGINDQIFLSDILKMKKTLYKTITYTLNNGKPVHDLGIKSDLLKGFFFVNTNDENILFMFKPKSDPTTDHTNLFYDAKIQLTFDLSSMDFARIYDFMLLLSSFRDIQDTYIDDYIDSKVFFEREIKAVEAEPSITQLPPQIHQYVMILIYIFITIIRFYTQDENGIDNAKYIKALLIFVMRSDVDEVMSWILEEDWTPEMKMVIKNLMLSIYANEVKKGIETQNYKRWFKYEEETFKTLPPELVNEAVNGILGIVEHNEDAHGICDYLGVNKIPMGTGNNKPASIKIELRMFDDDIQDLEYEEITKSVKTGKRGVWQDYMLKEGTIMPDRQSRIKSNRQGRLESNRPYGGGKRKTVKKSRRKKSGGRRKTKRRKI